MCDWTIESVLPASDNFWPIMLEYACVQMARGDDPEVAVVRVVFVVNPSSETILYPIDWLLLNGW